MAERFGQDLLLLEKLAAGGMAEVFRARQIGYGGFEKTVAVKRILSGYAMNEEFKDMFRLEANLCGHLQHSNVVQVFSNGEADSYLYLVMEFVDGKNVRQLLARADKKKAKIPIEIACFIVCEAAKGLDYAHNFTDEKTGQPMEIVHRDMSPQNIMLGYDGSVKIVDFGIAKAAARADNTRAGVLKGKFGYMSPEQAMGMKLDRRTDIFALGIVLFELLTQRRLFTSDDDLKTLQLVKDCRVPRPSKYNPAINPNLDRIVMKVLSKDKSERYSSAGELYGDLLRFINQKYPKFIHTDFSGFLRNLFNEDISEEKKRREKLNAEAPAIVAAPALKKYTDNVGAEKKKSKGKDPEAGDFTHVDDEERTEVSDVARQSGLSLPSVDSNVVSNASRSISPAPITSFELKEIGDSKTPLHIKDNFKTLDIHASPSLQLERATPGFSQAPLHFQNRLPKPRPVRSNRAALYGIAILVTGVGIWLQQAQNSAVVPALTHQVPVAVNSPAPSEPSAPANVVTENTPSSIAPQPENKDVGVKKNQEFDSPKRAPSSLPGYLNLDSVPRATEVLVDGKTVSDKSGAALGTPLKAYALAPGSHEIRLKNATFGASWVGTVTVESERIVNKDVVLK